VFANPHTVIILILAYASQRLMFVKIGITKEQEPHNLTTQTNDLAPGNVMLPVL